MKFRIILLVAFFNLTLLIGQNVPKYVLIEHFTNTWCPICAGKNPDLKALVEKYPKNVHHVSIHPPYPYSGCPLYQYNKTENLERATYYGVQGSPTVVINGGPRSTSTPLVSENTLKQEIAKTSPVSVVVSETKNGTARGATVRIKSTTALTGDFRLVVLIAEKNLRFTASNGELDHLNVFRKYLTPVSGQKIGNITTNEQKFDFNYNDASEWNANEVYVLAFVQNASTNEVLNSGTKFDAVSTGLKLDYNIQELKIYPTIANNTIWIETPTDKSAEYVVINARGEIMQKQKISAQKIQSINTQDFTSGVYWIQLTDHKKGIHIGKFVKR